MGNLYRDAVLALCCLVLAGCGTSIKGLLEEESRLLWQSEPVIAAAEAEGEGREERIYDAEAARHRACEKIIEAVRKQRDEGPGSFAQRFKSDFGQFASALVPIPSVERCAEAQDRYARELADLCRDLKEGDASLDCPG